MLPVYSDSHTDYQSFVIENLRKYYPAEIKQLLSVTNRRNKHTKSELLKKDLKIF